MEGSQRKRKKMMLYEVVFNDKYELPVFAGTINEVCEYTGRTKSSILTSISHNERYIRKGKQRGIRQKVVRAGWLDMTEDGDCSDD